jgi:hypothetical protein
MIAFTLILLSALAGGAVALTYGLKRAVMGYEDEEGFHVQAADPKTSGIEGRSMETDPNSTSRTVRPLGKKPLHTGPATV